MTPDRAATLQLVIALARAYQANKQLDEAKDELLAALEAAPGFRPAQKLLLELSTTAAK